jgi:hypothetical protein
MLLLEGYTYFKFYVPKVQLISKLSSTPQKSRSRFITVFSPRKNAFLKFDRHIFYVG